MKSEWCGYTDAPRFLGRDDPWRHGHWGRRIPRKRIACPKCGRRLIARISVCNDGCCVSYCVPRHKVGATRPRKASRKAGRSRIGRGRG